MAYIREGINAHVREFFDSRVHSSFIRFNPMLYFLGLQNAEARGKIGQPGTPAVFGNLDGIGHAEMQETLGSKGHFFTYVKAEPNDGGYISFGGETNVASSFAEDNFGQAETRWTHIWEPLRVRKHSLEMARGDNAIGAILDRAAAPVWNRFLKRTNSGLWTDSLTQAQQNAEVWGGFLGVQHTMTADNYYARVDRSVETELNPLVIDASTDLKSSVVDLNINRLINVGFTDENGNTVEGLAGKSPNATGATLFLTTSELWQELADQADGRYQIHTNGIPDRPMGGFKYPIIQKDNVYYTYDPDCPAGEMYCLNLDTWFVEINSGHNFTFTGFTDKSKTEEGGGYYEWGAYEAQIRLTCRSPWLNARITNLTTP